jgi:hypothetical protein
MPTEEHIAISIYALDFNEGTTVHVALDNTDATVYLEIPSFASPSAREGRVARTFPTFDCAEHALNRFFISLSTARAVTRLTTEACAS